MSNALKGLTFTAYTRPDRLSAEVQRRNKLITHLQEQLEMVRAETEGKAYSVNKRKWLRNDDGSKVAVEVSKRLKAWYSTQANGSVLLTVRYGSKPIEFEKGKAAIVVKTRDDLLVLIPKLIAAVESGDFDSHINSLTKQRIVGKKAA